MRYFAKIVSISVGAVAISLAIPATDGASMIRSAAAQESTPATCAVTTEAENEAVARRWFEEAVNGPDLTVIDEIVTEDVVHHSGTLPDTDGPDGVKAVLGVLLGGFPDAHQTIEQEISSDEYVVVRWHAEGTQEGEFQGYVPTGKPVTWTGINIFRFECGKIAESWVEVDGLGRLVQLELIATPAP